MIQILILIIAAAILLLLVWQMWQNNQLDTNLRILQQQALGIGQHGLDEGRSY